MVYQKLVNSTQIAHRQFDDSTSITLRYFIEGLSITRQSLADSFVCNSSVFPCLDSYSNVRRKLVDITSTAHLKFFLSSSTVYWYLDDVTATDHRTILYNLQVARQSPSITRQQIFCKELIDILSKIRRQFIDSSSTAN